MRGIQEELERDHAEEWYILEVKRIIAMVTHDNSGFSQAEKAKKIAEALQMVKVFANSKPEK